MIEVSAVIIKQEKGMSLKVILNDFGTAPFTIGSTYSTHEPEFFSNSINLIWVSLVCLIIKEIHDAVINP